MNNSLGEMLIRLKNAYLARHQSLELPYSRIREELAKILQNEGFLDKVIIVEEEKTNHKKILKTELSYHGRKGALGGVKQISKPSLKIYVTHKEMARLYRSGFRSGFGIFILSTTKGLMTSREARKQKLGGEVLCKIW